MNKAPGSAKTNLLKKIGAVSLGLIFLAIGADGLRDFVQPRRFIDGVVGQQWTTQGKYFQHPHIRIDDKDYKATSKAYSQALWNRRMRAEIGAGADRRVYSLQLITPR